MKDNHGFRGCRPPQHPLHVGEIKYSAQQINDLLDMIPKKADRKEILGLKAGFAPDEEDLTAVEVETSAVVKFKDRDTTKGKGYIILRTEKSLIEQMVQENTIYEVRYDFDLGGETLEVPANCMLDFKGGSISNGNVVLNRTEITGTQSAILCQVSGTLEADVDIEYFGVCKKNTGNVNVEHYNNINIPEFDYKFSTGVYEFSEPIQIKAYGVRGDSRKGTILKFPSSDGIVFGDYILETSDNISKRLHVNNLTIESYGNCIRFDNKTSYSRFENLYLISTNASGFYGGLRTNCYANYYSRIDFKTKLHAYDNVRHGIQTVLDNIGDLKIEGNFFNNCLLNRTIIQNSNLGWGVTMKHFVYIDQAMPNSGISHNDLTISNCNIEDCRSNPVVINHIPEGTNADYDFVNIFHIRDSMFNNPTSIMGNEVYTLNSGSYPYGLTKGTLADFAKFTPFVGHNIIADFVNTDIYYVDDYIGVKYENLVETNFTKESLFSYRSANLLYHANSIGRGYNVYFQEERSKRPLSSVFKSNAKITTYFKPYIKNLDLEDTRLNNIALLNRTVRIINGSMQYSVNESIYDLQAVNYNQVDVRNVSTGITTGILYFINNTGNEINFITENGTLKVSTGKVLEVFRMNGSNIMRVVVADEFNVE